MTHAQGQQPSARSESRMKAKASRELSLESMLSDEIVQLTMASDGVTPEQVRSLKRITPLHKGEVHPE